MPITAKENRSRYHGDVESESSTCLAAKTGTNQETGITINTAICLGQDLFNDAFLQVLGGNILW